MSWVNCRTAKDSSMGGIIPISTACCSRRTPSPEVVCFEDHRCSVLGSGADVDLNEFAGVGLVLIFFPRLRFQRCRRRSAVKEQPRPFFLFELLSDEGLNIGVDHPAAFVPYLDSGYAAVGQPRGQCLVQELKCSRFPGKEWACDHRANDVVGQTLGDVPRVGQGVPFRLGPDPEDNWCGNQDEGGETGGEKTAYSCPDLTSLDGLGVNVGGVYGFLRVESVHGVAACQFPAGSGKDAGGAGPGSPRERD